MDKTLLVLIPYSLIVYYLAWLIVKLRVDVRELKDRVSGLEFREGVRELENLPPIEQLETLKEIVDNKIKEITNGRN